MSAQVKTVGASGQISLGKKYAGRTVLIEETEEGVWVVKTAQTIPDNELWLHTEPFKSQLEAAIATMKDYKPQVTDLDEFEAKLMQRLQERDGKR